MTPLVTCARCHHPARYAIAHPAGVLVLCRHHGEQAAAVLRERPVLVDGRRLELAVPAGLAGRGR
jgi:hypothetical protein